MKQLMYFRTAILVLLIGIAASGAAKAGEGLRLSTFDIDVTPPIGGRLAYVPVTAHWDLGLRARGVVLLGAGDPIVLCAIDWLSVSNKAYDVFREAMAEAANTSVHRVALQAVHQHDAPSAELSSWDILEEYGHTTSRPNEAFIYDVIDRLAKAIRNSLDKTEPVTHVGTGEAEVYELAANRRILGPDGTVKGMRWSGSEPEIRNAPVGVMDPMVSLISFWNEETPIAVLSYFAIHPISYYQTGVANPDFVGVARFLRQMAVPDALHVYFTGAAGNIGTAKYNDGSKEFRRVQAERLTDGMTRAWEATERTPVTSEDVEWRLAPRTLPFAEHLAVERLERILDEGDPRNEVGRSARRLALIRRVEEGYRFDLSCLHVGPASIVHFPGESFVEYQLAAKAERPDRFVVMTAYADGPGYIGTAEAYEQGGYEVESRVTSVSPEVEEVLMGALRELIAP